MKKTAAFVSATTGRASLTGVETFEKWPGWSWSHTGTEKKLNGCTNNISSAVTKGRRDEGPLNSPPPPPASAPWRGADAPHQCSPGNRGTEEQGNLWSSSRVPIISGSKLAQLVWYHTRFPWRPCASFCVVGKLVTLRLNCWLFCTEEEASEVQSGPSFTYNLQQPPPPPPISTSNPLKTMALLNSYSPCRHGGGVPGSKNANKAKWSGDVFNSCVLTRLFEYAQRFNHNPAGAHTFTANDGYYLFNYHHVQPSAPASKRAAKCA